MQETAVEDALVAAAREGGHDPKNRPKKKNGKEGKPTPNHQIERRVRHPTKTEACVPVEGWEEGTRRKGE